MSVESPTRTDKQIAISALANLPESATLEEICEKIAVLAAIRRGEATADAGQTQTHAEVTKRSESWIGK